MNNIEQIAQFFNENEKFHGSVTQNELLSKHTTMNVGGNAGLFIEPFSNESLMLAVHILIEENVKFFILGGGSNVIISDAGLDAVISTRKINKVEELKDGTDQKHMICVDCGASWGSVISFCKKNDLGGFESFTGLSGTVGGALYMNATCFGLSACDNLVSADYLDLRDMKIHTYEKIDSDWGYKKSPFQKKETTDGHRLTQINGGGGATECERGERHLPSKLILSARFSVTNGFDLQKSQKCLSDRQEKGHFRAPSSGSAFKNDAAHGIIAGKVIDECGLKGFSCGGAQIAPWHGNFIINPEHKATAGDVKNLSEEVKRIVLEKTGVSLESEIIFVS